MTTPEAKGDGITDDTAAIQAGAPIHRGKYYIDHQGNPHKFYNPDDIRDHTYNGADDD